MSEETRDKLKEKLIEAQGLHVPPFYLYEPRQKLRVGDKQAKVSLRSCKLFVLFSIYLNCYFSKLSVPLVKLTTLSG